ncbi:MAG: hypothetical protein HKL80_12380 [Acidimicrobiales bacterium]|nr:hypothetical protein [Acidimicrobiales bacterium]
MKKLLAILLIVALSIMGSSFAQAAPVGSLSVTQGSGDSLNLSGSCGASNCTSATFYAKSNQFAGSNFMQIGQAQVDSVGKAQISYTPTWTGNTPFKVNFLGAGGSLIATQTLTFDVVKDPSGFPQSAIQFQRPLDSTGAIFVKILLTIVALVWLTLLGSFFLVVIRVPKLSKQASEEK